MLLEVHEEALSVKDCKSSSTPTLIRLSYLRQALNWGQTKRRTSSFSISSVSYQSLCHRLTFAMIEVEDVSRFRKLLTLAKHKSFVGSYAM